MATTTAPTLYVPGMPVRDIRHYDRSTKVRFKCQTHPANEWRSKDPYVSSWFTANSDKPDGAPREPLCKCKLDNYVVA